LGRQTADVKSPRTHRVAHELKHDTRTTMPEHLLFVDVETTLHEGEHDHTIHRLRLGVAIYLRVRRDTESVTRKVCRFTDAEEFWDFAFRCTHSHGVLYVIAHNAGFDLIVLQHMTHLVEAGYDPTFIAEGQSVFISKWRDGERTITILDNLNWFGGALEKWGQELGLHKMRMPAWEASDEEWYVYCQRDVEILVQLWEWYRSFLQEHDLGKWPITIASGALTAFRHRFLQHRIWIPDEAEESDIARAAYHGGRTEVFRVGRYDDGPFYKVDVNSMYPFVMREHRYPTSFEMRLQDVPLEKLSYTLRTHCAVATVTVDTPVPYFGYVWDGRNVYPTGRFVTTLCSEELRLAAARGWLVEVHDCTVYKARRIFRSYVDFFYRQKQEADRSGLRLQRAFAKLYLNSLYGKFGQRGYVDEVIGYDADFAFRCEPVYNAVTGEHYLYRQIGHKVMRTTRGGEAWNAFAAIAAHVTANARLVLYDAVQVAGREHCYYCDTDSLILDPVGYQRLGYLLDDQALGKWKLEAVAEEIEIVAPKHYRMDTVWKRKGIRRNAEQLSKNVFRQEIWPSYNRILREGVEEYFNYDIVKTIDPRIDCGYTAAEGYVIPFEMEGETIDAQPLLPF